MSGSKGQNDDGPSQTSFILEAQDRTQNEDSNKSNSDPLKSAKLRTVCLSLMTTMMGKVPLRIYRKNFTCICILR